MSKEEQFQAIYFFFVNTVHAYYITRGDVGSVIFQYALEELKDRAKKLDLTAVVVNTNGGYVLIVEKPEEYTIVSADLDLYTYEDEEEAV